MWDTDDPFAPLAWMRDRALIGIGQPWATARADGDVEWLAPDWQGTIGGPRDAFGAPSLPRRRGSGTAASWSSPA